MKYKRIPIILDNNTIAVLQIFTKDNPFHDLWIEDYIGNHVDYKQSAEQFIDHFEENICPAFIEQLAIKCINEYKQWCIDTNQQHLYDLFLTKIK